LLKVLKKICYGKEKSRKKGKESQKEKKIDVSPPLFKIIEISLT